MKKFNFLVLFTFLTLFCEAQNIAYYRTSIVYDNGKRVTGWLYDVNDSEISLISLKTKLTKDLLKTEHPEVEKIAITQNIKRITLFRKGKFIRTLSTLVGISLGGGLLIGYISGDNKNSKSDWFPTWESKALIYSFIGLYGTLYATIPISVLPNKVVYKGKIAENNLGKEFEKYTFLSQLNGTTGICVKMLFLYYAK